MSNIISYPGIQELEANDLMLITDVSKDDKPLRSISIGRLATYIEGGGGTSTSINGETGSITFVAGNNVTIDKVGKTFTINSAGGGGGGGVNGSGTTNKLPKWSGSNTLTDSILEDNGSTLTVYGSIQNKFPFVTSLDCNASGQNALALGLTTVASGSTSVAFGTNTTASGAQSFVGGNLSQSTASRSFAFGNDARAIGNDSVCFGGTTRAVTPFSMSIGSENIKNVTSDNTAFVIGRTGAVVDPFHVDFDGNTTANSFIKVGGLSTEYLMADGSTTTSGGGGGTIIIDSSASTIFAANAMTIAAKSTPSDKIVFWDNSAGALNYLTVGSGLSLSGTTLTATGGGGSTQNLFDTIAVSGQSDIVADSATDTLNFAAGTGIELTTNPLTDTVTIAATGGGGGVDTNEIAFFVEWPSSNTAVTNLSPMADWDISGMQWQWNYDGATGRYLLECKSEDWFDWGYRITMSANLNAFSNGKLIQVEMMRISKSTILVEAFQVDGTGVQRHDLIDTDMRGADIEPELGAYAQGLDIRIKRWPIGA